MRGRGIEMEEDQIVKAEQAADIIGILAALNRGNFIVEAGRKCGELSRAIVDVRSKGGKLVITLEFEPAGFAKDGRVNQLVIRPEVKITKPEHAQGKSIFFVTPDCKLTREDPDQDEFEFDKEKDTNGRRS